MVLVGDYGGCGFFRVGVVVIFRIDVLLRVFEVFVW